MPSPVHGLSTEAYKLAKRLQALETGKTYILVLTKGTNGCWVLSVMPSEGGKIEYLTPGNQR